MFFFQLFMGLAKICWPFIKESFLHGDTLKGYIRKNRELAFWLVLMLGMLCTVLYMYDRATSARDVAIQTIAENDRLKQQIVNLQQKQELFDAQRQADQIQIETLKGEVLELTSERDLQELTAQKYVTWLINCGIDPNYSGSRLPVCRTTTAPVRRPPRPRPQPKPAVPIIEEVPQPDPPKRGFLQRLRGIWGRDDNTDETGP